MKMTLRLVMAVACCFGGFAVSADLSGERVLVFSKTVGFRHKSIGAGVAMMKKMGAQHGFEVVATEDAETFVDDVLVGFRAVVFLNTTGDVLNDFQQQAFERYIRAGGGFVGIHSAADTEYDWPFYGKMVGAYFKCHPKVQPAKVQVCDCDHPATAHLGKEVTLTDEWYDFKKNPENVNVLMKLDHSSYEGWKHSEPTHPIAWYHEYEGGRAFYTGVGHTNEAFSDPKVTKHVAGALKWVSDGKKIDPTKMRPAENRFEQEILREKLEAPIAFEVLPDGRVLLIEQKGAVRLLSEDGSSMTEAAVIEIENKTKEDGLLGLALDPDFAKNGWIYLLYSPPVESIQRVSRFTFNGEKVDLKSEVMILEYPVQRDQCCHSGGYLAFGPNGNLFIGTGDNTNPHGSNGFSPSDEQADRKPWDAQRTAGNTADLRGKILRIKPQTQGGYEVPAGNLFPEGNGGRPEIYVMGCRNPYRFSIDPETAWLAWGEVGPDSRKAGDRGPLGYDEINLAQSAGNHGWPFFIGNNQAYADWDFKNEKIIAPPQDPSKPSNPSANNTGSKTLPPARSALIWYPYDASKEFPEIGSGGRTAMAGPFYRYDKASKAQYKFPEYFDNNLIIYEWMRNWIKAVRLDDKGQVVAIEPLFIGKDLARPIDMKFAADGSLYVLEWGNAFWGGGDGSRLSRFRFYEGNRRPVAAMTASATSGKEPLSVSFDGAGSNDPDGDAVTYSWNFGVDGKTATGSQASFTYTKPGTYVAKLTVTDASGVSHEAWETIVVGNSGPVVSFSKPGKGGFFFWGAENHYEVEVKDLEDGSTQDGGISRKDIRVSVSYEGKDAERVSAGLGGSVNDMPGFKLLKTKAPTCLGCHQVEHETFGPSYKRVAATYKDHKAALPILVKSIRGGGTGKYGDKMMPPHPQVTVEDATQIAQWILAQGGDGGTLRTGSGSFAVPERPADGGGTFTLTATYGDRGHNGAPSIAASTSIQLREPVIAGGQYDAKFGSMRSPNKQEVGYIDTGHWLGYDDLPLNGVTRITLQASTPKDGSRIHIHLDSPTGPEIAVAQVPNTGGWGKWARIDCNLKKPIAGNHRLVLRFVHPKDKGGVCNFRSIEFGR